MKLYIAGKITGLSNYKELFNGAEVKLNSEGHTTLNPSVMPKGFKQDEYMHICYAMIDVCEGVYFLNNWQDSPGAKLEYEYAVKYSKKIFFQEESTND